MFTVLSCVYETRYACMWTYTVQTRVVQRSTIYVLVVSFLGQLFSEWRGWRVWFGIKTSPHLGNGTLSNGKHTPTGML